MLNRTLLWIVMLVLILWCPSCTYAYKYSLDTEHSTKENWLVSSEFFSNLALLRLIPFQSAETRYYFQTYWNLFHIDIYIKVDVKLVFSREHAPPKIVIFHSISDSASVIYCFSVRNGQNGKQKYHVEFWKSPKTIIEIRSHPFLHSRVEALQIQVIFLRSEFLVFSSILSFVFFRSLVKKIVV